MIEANRGQTEEVLLALKAESYERFRIQVFQGIDMLLKDFEMNWDDLAKKLGLRRSGESLKHYVGTCSLRVEEINAIAHIFSAEPYLIFRPRFPWTKT